ncbi:unnamed protein product [Adineta steineri]|uniref:N-acetyltransferase domain-containing protein n=1 Tax=Adineta steineri TaxID=433720 RepID=A0A819DH83_9BILA|nr:unnamed protein product [Adineta steineri]CAF3829242.1 unnamed protein product [Adineta steineri]
MATTDSEVLIRRATINDAKGINSLLADSFSLSFPFYNYLLPKGQSNRELVFEYWHKEALVMNDIAYVATINGKIVGALIGRYRPASFVPSDAENHELSPEQKILVGYDDYTQEQMEMIMTFLHNFDFCYADWARQAQQYLPSGTPYVYIRGMTVSEDHQKKGIGLRLLSMVLKEAKKLEAATFLEASPAGTPLYLKAGAEKGGILVTKDREGNVIMEEFCMVWRNYDLI